MRETAPRSWRLSGFLCALILILAATALGQTDRGQISGKVVDPNDAVVTDATVTITNLATASRQVTQTNSEGLFAVGNIRVGEYEVSIEKTGFKKAVQRVKVEVAQRLNLPITLQLGGTSETVEVNATNVAVINTVSAEVSHEITGTEITNLPLLTRNPYALMELAPGSVNANVATGDFANGLGISNSGSRGRSINFLLDGSENNDSFVTGPSTLVPVDAIQEFKLQTNNMTAEFGRNSLQANVATKSGSNSFHGSASEFYRGSALSSQPVEEKSQDLAKGRFVRNVFGAAVGGPIVKDKTFFYGAFEGTRVRGNSKDFFYVPTDQFFANASSNMQDYMTASGPIDATALPEVITAGQLDALDGITLVTSGTDSVIPDDTPLFQHVFTTVPIDGGGAPPQNTWAFFARGDHQISDRTSLSLRYAWYRQELFPGFTSDSPFSDFRTGQSFRSQNATVGLTHAFSSRLFNESRFTFSRTTPNAPLGKGSANVACFLYANATAFTDPIAFGGYLPRSCAGNSLPAGGPQNTLSGYTGFTYSRGRNTWKFGGYLRHLRDNHTFGAFENGFGLGITMQSMLDGVTDGDFRVAFNPHGVLPLQTYDPAVQGPVEPPSFTRHYRYNEYAWYAEDSIKLLPRLTLTAGLRWEYFGVLHSPDGEKNLDSNLFLGTTGNIYQQIADGQFRQANNLFNQDFNNFGPRLAIAWDVTGDSRTVFRAGYGMFYDANFGNALFNVIQNPPAYAVVQAPGGRIFPNQYDTLADVLGTGTFTYASSARMLNKDMVTSYSQQWNATLEHDLLGKGVLVSLAYVGAKGDKLYSLNNLNQRGSCILLDTCDDNFRRRLNTGITGMNRRGNEGFSRYNSMQFGVRTREIARTGLQLNANYTWAHSIDNSTSFFNDSAFDFNGNFGFGDPYNPAADKGNSSNDIRHRFALNYSWEIPWARNLTGASGAAFGGWMLSGVLTAQTGGAFSVYENPAGYDDPCSASVADVCYPVVTGPLPHRDGRTPASAANRVVLYDFAGSLTDLGTYCEGDQECEAQTYFNQPSGLFLHRNSFRTPGYWNFDAAVLKNFKLPWESVGLQFRAEFFNLFNHSNLYADPNTNLLASGQALARRGVPPSHELYGTPFDRRNIQLGLRLTF
ncbi:MAG TPA: TonB-dependent receptor [Terriglobales bacterium]|nr:TonB-dependent receptor [Terriglobales bacterium]